MDININQYFKKGAPVEISSDEQGFRGSLFAGIIVQPPIDVNQLSAKVLVEYKTLMEDKVSKRRLREEIELINLRPPPPEENRHIFIFGVDVDAYFNGVWWVGVVTGVIGEGDKYSVFFRCSREQIAFRAEKLRLHREWVNGIWVPPVEPQLEGKPMNKRRKSKKRPLTPLPTVAELCEMDTDRDMETQKLPLPTEVEAEVEVIEYDPEELVEIRNDEEGFEGAWFAATVVEQLNSGKYLIEYQSLRNDDDTEFLREEVDSLHMRPRPPDVEIVDRFEVLEEVDAFYNDGWWRGMIYKVLKKERYSVYFEDTGEELKFEHSDLRVHQEWINGKWVLSSKDLEL